MSDPTSNDHAAQVQEGWVRAPLARFLTPNVETVDVDPGQTYPTVGVLNRGRGLLYREPVAGSSTSYKKLNRIGPRVLVYSRLKAFEGAITVTPDDLSESFASQEFPTFAFAFDADPDFFRILTTTQRMWNALQGVSKGMGGRRERVKPADFLNISMDIPPLPVQERIVEVIGAVDDQIDALGAEAEALDALLRGRKEELFAHYAATKATLPIGQVLEEVKRPITVAPETEYRQIGVRSHGRGLFTKESVTGESLGAKKVFWVEPGDLVINIVFAWEGAVAIVPPEIVGYCGSHRFPVYRRLDGGDIEFFRLFFSTKIGTRLLADCSPGGAGRNRTLNRKRLMQSPIAMPSAQEQERTICRLQALDAQVVALRSEAARLRQVRASLLAGLLDRTIDIESAELEV